MKSEEIAELISTIRNRYNTDTLRLKGNFKSVIPSIEHIFRAIQPSITHFNFSHCDLAYLTPKEEERFYLAIPLQIKSLDLTRNLFGFSSNDALEHTFELFPRHLESLSLRHNHLGAGKLSKIINKLPQNLKHLDLSLNELEHADLENFKAIIKALPHNLESLTLEIDPSYLDPKDSWTGHHLSSEQLVEMFEDLPDTCLVKGFNLEEMREEVARNDRPGLSK